MSETTQPKRIVMARLGRVEDQDDRAFDEEFWQAHDTAARWQAAAELLEYDFEQRGVSPDERQLQRTVVRFHRPKG